MRTRQIKTFIDNDNIERREMVWFNSYGKEILYEAKSYELTQEQLDEFNTEKELVFDFNEIHENQSFNIEYKSNVDFQVITNYYTIVCPAGENKRSFTLQENETLDSFNIVTNSTEEVTYLESFKLNAEEYGIAKKANNFSEKQSSVRDALIQKLSTFQRELWYAYSFGLPLFEKYRTKLLLDSFIIQTVNQQDDVISVENFNSYIENKTYKCNMIIQSTFGEIEINL